MALNPLEAPVDHRLVALNPFQTSVEDCVALARLLAQRHQPRVDHGELLAGLVLERGQAAFDPAQAAFDPAQAAFDPAQAAFDPAQANLDPVELAFEAIHPAAEAVDFSANIKCPSATIPMSRSNPRT